MNEPTPDVEVKAFGPSTESTLLTLAVLGVVVLLLSMITFLPRGQGGDARVIDEVTPVDAVPQDDEVLGDVPEGTGPVEGEQAGLGQAGGGSGGPRAATDTRGKAVQADPGIDCAAGRNGSPQEAGVTKSSIKLGAVTVDSGPGASFLHPVVIAMEAVRAKTNKAGGVCGRKLDLVMRDSGWVAQKGYQAIQNLVEGEKVFALAVNPDSEGLDLASASGYLGQKKVPVVGTDGLVISQYKDPYIWPVAAPTVSAMYAIAKSQCESGLRTFSIVFETTYRFGREGARAYDTAAKACTGKPIAGSYDPRQGQAQCRENFCGILGAATSYNDKVAAFCKGTPTCDAGALLLEPATAQVWLANGGLNPQGYGAGERPGALGTPQPLFSESFAKQCNRTCNLLRVWTGFNPPIEQFSGMPPVQQYVNDVRAIDPGVDVDNQFVEGGYLGMLLLVKAMDEASRASGGLTRANLAAVLDNTQNFDSGLTVEPLSWSKGNHFAQTTVHAFDEQYGETGFGGWRYTGIKIKDPDPTGWEG